MDKNFKIGCHLSSSNGYLAMAKQILLLNGNTFQFFTRNPQGGQVKPLDLDDIAKDFPDMDDDDNDGLPF